MVNRQHLTNEFFARPAETVARDLLGQYLAVRHGSVVVYATVVETEAYTGPEDKACHAHRGRTKRTEVMYHEPGTWYVYLIYGMYDMLNVVTDMAEHPAAVLIRGARTEAALYDGPGKLTRALAIDRSYNDTAAKPETGLWFTTGQPVDDSNVRCLPRVGVQYAQEWADAPLRFRVNTI
jgi:DNA-3-methyladenine glycosylase